MDSFGSMAVVGDALACDAERFASDKNGVTANADSSVADRGFESLDLAIGRATGSHIAYSFTGGDVRRIAGETHLCRAGSQRDCFASR